MASIAIDSLVNVKDYLGIDRHEYAHDPVLLIWMEEIAGEIEDALGQPVLSIAKTDIVDGSGDCEQYMYSGRIISLVGTSEALRMASLVYRDAVGGVWTSIMTDEDYVHIGTNGWTIELLDGEVFPYGQKNIKIVYNCGFSPVPSDLKLVFKQKIQTRFDESKYGGKPRLGMSSVNRSAAGANSGDSFHDMELRWQRIYDRYKRLL
jgi:hypothetical protein